MIPTKKKHHQATPMDIPHTSRSDVFENTHPGECSGKTNQLTGGNYSYKSYENPICKTINSILTTMKHQVKRSNHPFFSSFNDSSNGLQDNPTQN